MKQIRLVSLSVINKELLITAQIWEVLLLSINQRIKSKEHR